MKDLSLKNRLLTISMLMLFMTNGLFSQSETSRWKAQIAFGLNMPGNSGFVNGFEGKSANFPTINLGVQRMFKPQYGVKLDYGFNRLGHASNAPYFKINYSRINAQFVYDATKALQFLPMSMGIIGHAGPGLSLVKPLTYTNNNVTFVNAIAGIEFHYAVSRTFSVYLDASYIFGFAGDFDPLTEGYGSFNGSLFTATIGLSVSLSGCYFCE